MALEAWHVDLGHVRVLTLSGEADIATCAILQEQLERVVQLSRGPVVLDLTALRFCDVLCAQMILACASTTRLCLAGAAAVVQRLFDLLDPLQRVPRYSTIGDAISQPGPEPGAPSRQWAEVADLASRLERRIYLVPCDDAALEHECAQAREWGLGAVICPPEQVAAATRHLGGSGVQVVTGLPRSEPGSQPQSGTALVREATRLAADGAAWLGVAAARAQLTGPGLSAFCALLRPVCSVLDEQGSALRVLLNLRGLSGPEITDACEALVAAGVGLVQGGSAQGPDRSGLSQIQVMRAALPPSVLLKWTHPVRTVDIMLICIAEGVDRFNADIAKLLASASEAAGNTKLRLPVRGLDY